MEYVLIKVYTWAGRSAHTLRVPTAGSRRLQSIHRTCSASTQMLAGRQVGRRRDGPVAVRRTSDRHHLVQTSAEPQKSSRRCSGICVTASLVQHPLAPAASLDASADHAPCRLCIAGENSSCRIDRHQATAQTPDTVDTCRLTCLRAACMTSER